MLARASWSQHDPWISVKAQTPWRRSSVPSTAAIPFSGVIYVFRAKRSDRIKLIWWDGTGLCLMAKKLEQGGFRWPGIQDGVMRITAAQLGALLEGLDWRRVHGGRRPQAPQIAG